MTAVLRPSQYEVIVTPGRSSFDAARWRCGGTGESCGVWYSVYARPWENPRDVAHKLAVAHMKGSTHAPH